MRADRDPDRRSIPQLGIVRRGTPPGAGGRDSCAGAARAPGRAPARGRRADRVARWRSWKRCGPSATEAAALVGRSDVASSRRSEYSEDGVPRDSRGRGRWPTHARSEAELALVRARGESGAAGEGLESVARRRAERAGSRARGDRGGGESWPCTRSSTARSPISAPISTPTSGPISRISASGFLRDLTNGRYTDLELDEDYCTTLSWRTASQGRDLQRRGGHRQPRAAAGHQPDDRRAARGSRCRSSSSTRSSGRSTMIAASRWSICSRELG